MIWRTIRMIKRFNPIFDARRKFQFLIVSYTKDNILSASTSEGPIEEEF